jgi:hypothetical protein
VLIHPERLPTCESSGPLEPSGRLGFDAGPGGVPVDTEVPGERGDRGVIMRQSVGGPS